MRGEQHGGAERLAQAADEVDDLEAGRRVERTRGFVGEQEAWAVDERAGQGDALLLTAGEGVRGDAGARREADDLERLARDGLAETHREPQEARPDRLVYTLTDAGRTELASWFDAPVKITSGYRDDFFLKLAAARSLGDAGLIRRIVDARRTALLQELRDLAALGAESAASTYDGLLTQAAEIQTRGLLQLLDQVDAAADALVAEASGTARVRVNDASVGRRRTAS